MEHILDGKVEAEKKNIGNCPLFASRQKVICAIILLNNNNSTGHVALNRHFTVMKIHTDPLCPRYGEEEETACHFLGRCSAMMLAHYSILGSYLMDITELQQVQPYTLLKFAKASKRFI